MVKPISRNTISTIRQLHHAKYRKETGLFIAEGEKLVEELLLSAFKIRLLACLSSYYDRHAGRLEALDVHLVNDDELSRISLMQTPNRVLAVVELPAVKEVNYGAEGLYLMLDGIRDPGNMGTIIRSAEWFGVKAVLCSADCVDAFMPKVVQGTMGSVFRMPVIYGSLEEMIGKFHTAGAADIIGAVLGGTPVQQSPKASGTRVLVIGSEASGIGSGVMSLLKTKVSIPEAPGSKAESLNAAVACGILLYLMAAK